MFVVSDKVVRKYLMQLLSDMGIVPSLSKAIASEFIKNNHLLWYWTKWYQVNCMNCSRDAQTCDFFNPKRVQGITEEEVIKINLTKAEEHGLNTRCPLLDPVET